MYVLAFYSLFTLVSRKSVTGTKIFAVTVNQLLVTTAFALESNALKKEVEGYCPRYSRNKNLFEVDFFQKIIQYRIKEYHFVNDFFYIL